jgi:hypothetical protein
MSVINNFVPAFALILAGMYRLRKTVYDIREASLDGAGALRRGWRANIMATSSRNAKSQPSASRSGPHREGVTRPVLLPLCVQRWLFH